MPTKRELFNALAAEARAHAAAVTGGAVPYTIPAEHLRPGHCIALNGRGAEVEEIMELDDDSAVVSIRVRFDGAWELDGFDIDYGTPIELLHKSQFDQWKAVQDAAAAKPDATLDALRQPVEAA